MKRNSFLVGVLSLVIPGLGQMACGQGTRGAAILVAAVVVGSMNILFIPVFVIAGPVPEGGWSYWIPRVGHDVVALWSVVFWVWAVVDAFLLARNG